MATSKPQKLKLPPQNLDAEQAVLGSIMIDKNAIYRVADLLTPPDFYSPANETIFDAILTLHEKRQPIAPHPAQFARGDEKHSRPRRRSHRRLSCQAA